MGETGHSGVPAVHFRTVFDASQNGYATWWFAAVGLLFVCFGALLVFAPATANRLMPAGLQGRSRTLFGWTFLLFAVAWTLLNFEDTYQKYRDATTALRNRQYSVVEGPVTDFVPMPFTGHAMERFTVGGRRFSYSDYVLTIGFHHTASHGGPIREGRYVRVSYVGNLILRLEVAQ
jgi:hypothetical protein